MLEYVLSTWLRLEAGFPRILFPAWFQKRVGLDQKAEMMPKPLLWEGTEQLDTRTANK